MNVKLLKQVVSLAEPFLMSQDFIPILQHFWFHPDHVTAYNDIQAIQLAFSSDLHCAVPGKTLSRLLDTINYESIDVTMDDKTLLLGSGKNKAKLPILPKEEFVFAFPDPSGVKVDLDDSMSTGLEQCLSTVGYNPTQPERNGISVCLEKEHVTFYTTDGVAISRFRKEWKCQISELEQLWIILPTFFCEQLVKVAKSERLIASLHLSEDFVVALIGNHKIFSRVINAKPPRFDSALRKFIPGDLTDLNLHPIPEDLPWAISRAILMLYPEKGITTSLMTLKPNGKLTILTESDRGRVFDELDTPIKNDQSETIVLKISPAQIKRALDICSSFSIFNSVFIFSEPTNQFYSLVSTQS